MQGSKRDNNQPIEKQNVDNQSEGNISRRGGKGEKMDEAKRGKLS